VNPAGRKGDDLSSSGSKKRKKEKEAAGRMAAVTAFLSPVRGALAWPRIYGWVGIAFAFSGLWFLPSGLVLRSRAASLAEGAPGAREAAESARHLGFGEVGPLETATSEGEKKRWSSPFGFMAPSLRRERDEGDPAGGRPSYAIQDDLAARSLVIAREGAEANARASIVFGVFCLAAAGFWWGFRLLDPSVRRAAPAASAGTQ
jgi:hypothetical protein